MSSCPPEILLKIFDLLSLRERFMCAMVSKSWNSAIITHFCQHKEHSNIKNVTVGHLISYYHPWTAPEFKLIIGADTESEFFQKQALIFSTDSNCFGFSVDFGCLTLGPLIETLQITISNTNLHMEIWRLLKNFGNIRNLELEFYDLKCVTPCFNRGKQDDDLIFPHLESAKFVISQSDSCSKSAQENAVLDILDFLASCQNLKNFECIIPDNFDQNLSQHFTVAATLQLGPSLERFSFSTIVSTNQLQQLCTRLTNLDTLQLAICLSIGAQSFLGHFSLMKKLKSLKLIILSDQMPKSVKFQSTSVQHLEIFSTNSISNIHHHFPLLEKLEIRQNAVCAEWLGQISKLKYLKRLTLEDCLLPTPILMNNWGKFLVSSEKASSCPLEYICLKEVELQADFFFELLKFGPKSLEIDNSRSFPILGNSNSHSHFDFWQHNFQKWAIIWDFMTKKLSKVQILHMRCPQEASYMWKKGNMQAFLSEVQTEYSCQASVSNDCHFEICGRDKESLQKELVVTYYCNKENV